MISVLKMAFGPANWYLTYNMRYGRAPNDWIARPYKVKC